MSKIELTTLQNIQQIKQKEFNYNRSTAYYINLMPLKDFVEQLTKTSFELWGTKPNVSRNQVKNTLESNRTGHIRHILCRTCNGAFLLEGIENRLNTLVNRVGITLKEGI
ncbi:hypothetical protein [Shewanella baltica]|uniref:hypothetical protein n=1 Tax=Shewanella baltica TaxID=62322 RepID=UPI003D790414